MSAETAVEHIMFYSCFSRQVVFISKISPSFKTYKL